MNHVHTIIQRVLGVIHSFFRGYPFKNMGPRFGLILMVVLSGCHAAQWSAMPAVPTEAASVETIVKEATTATQLLLAVEDTLAMHDTEKAERILAHATPETYRGGELVQYQLLMAKIALLKGHVQTAWNHVKSLQHVDQLSHKIQVAVHQTLAEVYEQKNQLPNAVRQYIILDGLLITHEDIIENQQALWTVLQKIPRQQTLWLAKKAETTLLKGWLSLSALAQETDGNSAAFLSQLSLWSKTYPLHPAHRFFMDVNTDRDKSTGSKIRHVALLLPLQGPLGEVGTAIRNGFFAAHRQQKNTPIEIRVYDTSQADILTIYRQAVNQGADFVMGPLSKSAIASLMGEASIQVPTVVLNTVDSTVPWNAQKPLLQFGLSPYDEVLQMAQKAWDKHHKRAMMIVPDNFSGASMAQILANQWEAQGGQVVQQINFSNQQHVDHDIRRYLGIAQSDYRAHKLQQTVGEKLRSVPRRRQDIDVIFLLAQPYQARQIRPLLQFYYGGDIPTYGISSIYSGYPSPREDADMNGVVFSDAPWVVGSDRDLPSWLVSLRHEIKGLWPDTYKNYARFYAFGIDAYTVLRHYAHFMILPYWGVQGATGRLYLAAHQRIHRRVAWARMQSGKPVMLAN